MEFTVNQKALAKELSLARSVVERDSTIPVLANVLLEARGDRVFLTATNLDLAIRCSCRAAVKTEGSGTLPARKLADYTKLLDEGDVRLRWDGAWAQLNNGRSRARIAGMSRESFPELPSAAEATGSGRISGAVLAALIAGTSMAISAEESRFTLDGALMCGGAAGLTMVATDGHRLSYMRTTPDQAAEVDRGYRAIVPRRALQEIVRLVAAEKEAAVELSGDDNHLYFGVGDRELSARKIAGNFPDFERVLPRDADYRLRLHRDEMRAVVERVLQFSDGRSRCVKLRLESGEMRVYSSMPELGESEESVPVEYSGKAVERAFNGGYLMDFLRASPTSHVSLLLRDDVKSAGELRPDAEFAGEYRYVVMPMAA
jgi:DNA polymerase III subunit beta